MSTTYYSAKVSATMTVECVCEKCEQPYSYPIKILGEGSKSVPGLISAADEVKNEAVNLALLQIEKRLKDQDFEADPCPNCGYVQSWQLKSHSAFEAQGAAGCAFLAAGLLLGIPFGIYATRNAMSGGRVWAVVAGILVVAGIIAFVAAKIAKSRAGKGERVERINTPSVSWKWDEHYEGVGDMIRKGYQQAFHPDKDKDAES